MSFYNKKYYKQRNKELDEANDKLKIEVRSLRNAVRFMLSQKNVYNVEYAAAHTLWGDSETKTDFEYVDAEGKHHRVTRDFKFANLALLSTSPEAAIFGYQQEDKTTYWLLNKADELFAEIPEAILCHRDIKICELKETIHG